MPARSQVLRKKSQQSSLSKFSDKNPAFVVLREENSDRFTIQQLSKVVSAKNLSKVGVGDTISYGPRGKEVRGVIVLVGAEAECQQSLEILQPTKTTSMSSNNLDSSIGPISHPSAKDGIDRARMEEDIADADGFDSEDREIEDEEGAYLSDKENEKENDPINSNISPSPILTANRINSPRLNTESSISLKRKTPPVHSSPPHSSTNKRSKSLGFISMKEHSKVVSQLAQMNDENMVLQTTWMPRPTDKQTVDYFIHIGKVLSSSADELSSGGDDQLDRGEILDFICSTLNMTEAELTACTGRTLLSTARQVVGKKYPDFSASFGDVKKEHIQAIADYAWLVHPLEKKSNDMSKVRKAMGNVFATRKFSQKLKGRSAPLNSTATDDESNAST